MFMFYFALLLVSEYYMMRVYGTGCFDAETMSLILNLRCELHAE